MDYQFEMSSDSESSVQCRVCFAVGDDIPSACCLAMCVHFVDKVSGDKISSPPQNTCHCDFSAKSRDIHVCEVQGQESKFKRQNSCLHSTAAASLPELLDFALDGVNNEKYVVSRVGIPVRSVFGPLVAPLRTARHSYCLPDLSQRTPTRFQNTHLRKFNLNSTLCNWMKYVRCAPENTDPNLLSFRLDGKIYFVVVRDICPGQELRIQGAYFFKDNEAVLKSVPASSSQSATNSTLCQRNKSVMTDGQDDVAFAEIGSGVELLDSYVQDTPLVVAEKHISGTSQLTKRYCTICQGSCPTDKLLQRHMKEKHRETLVRKHTQGYPFEKDQCFVCLKLIPGTSADLRAHELTHTNDEGVLCCEQCGLTFVSRGKFKQHQEKLHLPPRYPCTVCGIGFRQSTHLEAHADTHAASRFLCPLCPLEFVQRVLVKKHLRATHLVGCTKEKVKEYLAKAKPTQTVYKRRAAENYEGCLYKCRKCRLGFGARAMLVGHMEARHPETSICTVPELNLPMQKMRGYRCKRCRHSCFFVTKELADTHLQRKHPEMTVDLDDENQTEFSRYDTEAHFCEVCNIPFPRARAFFNHAKSLHPEYFALLMPVDDGYMNASKIHVQ